MEGKVKKFGNPALYRLEVIKNCLCLGLKLIYSLKKKYATNIIMYVDVSPPPPPRIKYIFIYRARIQLHIFTYNTHKQIN